METRSTNALLGAIAVILLVAGVAFPFLNMPMWTDEMSTIRQIGAAPLYQPVTLGEMVASVARDDPWQAPGYYTLAYSWGHVVGWSPLALRLLSLFSGLIALSITFNLVKRHFSPRTGIYAILTMGMGAIFLNYLHDMRTYAILVLFITLMIWAYERVVRARHVRIWHYAALSLTIAALLYLHYFAAFAIAGLGLYHIIFRFRKPRYWQTVVCFVIGGISFLPWAQVLINGLALSVDNPRRRLNMAPLEAIGNMLDLFANGNLALMLVLVLLALRVRTKAARFVWVWLIASTTFVLIASRFFPALYDIRYLLFLWPGLGVVAGLGIARLQRLGISPFILVGIWLVVFARQVNTNGPMYDIVGSNYRPPFDNLGHQLEGRTLKTDVLMYHLPENAPNDTMHPELLNYYTASQELGRRVLIPDTTATTDLLYQQFVFEAIDGAPRVWLAYQKSRRNWRIGPVTEDYLPQKGFLYCGSLPDSGQRVHVELWAHPRSTSSAESYVFQDAEGHTVSLYSLQTPTLVGDNDLFTNVLWQLSEPIPLSVYSFGLLLFNENNQVVAQLDHGLDINQGCLAGDINVRSIPGGNYHLHLTVYNWQTGERLDPVGEEQDDQLFDLGTIALSR